MKKNVCEYVHRCNVYVSVFLLLIGQFNPTQHRDIILKNSVCRHVVYSIGSGASSPVRVNDGKSFEDVCYESQLK